MQTVIIKQDSTVIEVSPKNGTDFSLEEMQEIVGGYIEIVSCDKPGWLIVLNEEGKLKELKENFLATQLCFDTIGEHDYIVGDVLLCKQEQVK